MNDHNQASVPQLPSSQILTSESDSDNKWSATEEGHSMPSSQILTCDSDTKWSATEEGHSMPSSQILTSDSDNKWSATGTFSIPFLISDRYVWYA